LQVSYNSVAEDLNLLGCYTLSADRRRHFEGSSSGWSSFLGLLTLKMKAVGSSTVLVRTYSVTHH